MHETPDATVTQPQSQGHNYEPSIGANESSFLPGQAAFSSTPATARVMHTQDTFASGTSDDPSWTTSVESPLVRLDREIREFSEDNDRDLLPANSKHMPSLRFDKPTPNLKQDERSMHTARSDKGKGKEADPLLRSVLRHNLHSISDTSSAPISPHKFKGKVKTPIPKKSNPYLPPNKSPAEWNGIVDLRDPSVMTPLRHRHQRTKTPSSRRKPTTPAKESDDEDSFNGLPPGMSPPVMMSPARPPRSSAELGLLKLGQTPIRQATARITRDLVQDIQYKSGGQARHMPGYGYSRTESTMSTVPTPPSLSRYARLDTTDSIVIDSSLDSMMKRVGLSMPTTGIASTPGLRLRPKAARVAAAPVLQTDDTVTAPAPVAPITPVDRNDDHSNDAHADIDSDLDSLDDIEVNNSAYPSAAFMMASAQSSHDDSFGSSSSHSEDSLNAEDNVDLGMAPIHPFAMSVEDTAFDDTFDDDMYDNRARVDQPDDPTLFGVPPQQRMRAAQAQRLGEGQEHLGQGQQGQPELRMLGEDLLEDTIGIGVQVARRGSVEESPTPAPQAGLR